MDSTMLLSRCARYRQPVAIWKWQTAGTCRRAESAAGSSAARTDWTLRLISRPAPWKTAARRLPAAPSADASGRAAREIDAARWRLRSVRGADAGARLRVHKYPPVGVRMAVINANRIRRALARNTDNAALRAGDGAAAYACRGSLRWLT